MGFPEILRYGDALLATDDCTLFFAFSHAGERCVEDYDIISQVGEGTYGQVYKAKRKANGMKIMFIFLPEVF